MRIIMALGVVALVWAGGPASAQPAGETIHLFNGENLDNFYTFIRDRGRDVDPKGVFTVQDGLLRISGEEWGCITTEEEFDNYHLITEWKWGEKTWEPRLDRARDSGILVHSQGEDGGYSGIWMHSIECQIIEGGTGDIIVVGNGTDDFTATCPVAPEMQGSSHVYRPGGELATRNGGRINWWGRDPEWKDELGFRGKFDVESPVGEWNRLECIVRGDTMQIILNGVVVNEAVDMTPKKGRIQVQSEAAELFFRTIDLIPLGPEPREPREPREARGMALPGRFIYNSDANNMFLYQDVPMTPEDLYPYVDELANTQITTLFMSPNNGMVMNYPSEVSGMLGEGRYDELPPAEETEPKSAERTALLFKSLVDAGHDPLGLVLDRAQSHGLETFMSFRMNEVHATEDPDSLILSKFWKDHPEYHIGTPGDPLEPIYWQILGPRTHPIVGTWLPGGFNYAEPEVRAYRLRQLREVLERYDVAGLDLDFQRFPMYFKPGEETAHIATMTGFVREVRALVDDVAGKRGKEILLVARILATPEQNRAVGLDPVAWAEEGLLDFVTVSHYLRNDYILDIRRWRELLPEGMPVYASLEYEPLEWTYRNLARRLYGEGADGLMLFNFFARRESGKKEPFTFLFKELGHPDTILGPLPHFPKPELAKREGPILLVVNKHGDSLSYVDPETLEELERVPTGHDPHELVITPDQRYAYISNYAPPGDSVTVIDLVKGEYARLIPTGPYTRIHSAALSPDGCHAYFTAGQTGYVVEIDTETNQVTRGIPTEGKISHMVMVSPDGSKLYTANITSQNVSVIDRTSGTLIAQVPCEAGCEGLMFTPDGKHLWAANQNAGSITIIDTATHEAVGRIDIPGMPLRIKFTEDGARALVTNWVEQGELVVIDVAAREEIKRIPVGNQPIGIEISPGGGRAFVTNMTSDEVYVIDLESLEVVDRFETGAGVDAMAWWFPPKG